MFVDFVLNGQGNGPVGSTLQNCYFDPGLLRPFVDNRGQRCVMMQQGRRTDEKTGMPVPVYKKVLISNLQARGINSPVFNASSLRKDEWIQLDTSVTRANRLRLRAWADLETANPRGGFNAMSKMTLEYQAMNDVGEAVVDMDAITDARRDRPAFDLKSIPLPITHADFWFSQREILVSRNTGTPLDTTMAENSGRRIAETVEKTLIGLETGMTYGNRSTGPQPLTGSSTVYGYTNFPYRVTKTDLTAPTGNNPEAVLNDVLEMVEQMQANGFFGPYIIYHSTGYSRYLSDDYFRAGSTSAVRSLRERLMEVEGILDFRRLDFLNTGHQLIMVQMTREVAEAINGMEVTTVQWESQGGLRLNFKVMAIKVPLLKAPYNGVAGIMHATAA